jgi:hypothetical protein
LSNIGDDLRKIGKKENLEWCPIGAPTLADWDEL